MWTVCSTTPHPLISRLILQFPLYFLCVRGQNIYLLRLDWRGCLVLPFHNSSHNVKRKHAADLVLENQPLCVTLIPGPQRTGGDRLWRDIQIRHGVSKSLAGEGAQRGEEGEPVRKRTYPFLMIWYDQIKLTKPSLFQRHEETQSVLTMSIIWCCNLLINWVNCSINCLLSPCL